MLKYTYIQKAKSVALNLIKANWKDIINYLISRINNKYKTNIDITFSGDLTKEEDYDPRDYTLSSTEAKKLPKLEREKLYLIDQGRAYRTRNSCVPTNVYLQICNNLNVRPDYKELSEWLNWLEKEGLWKENSGAVIPRVVKAMCTRWNELHPDRKVRYDRLVYNNTALIEALKNGYEVTGGRNTFSAYSNDKRDGKIDFDNYEGWKRAGGHCLNIMLGSELKKRKQIEIEPNNAEKRAFASVKSDNIHGVNSYPTIQKDLNLYEHKRLGKHCQNRIWFSRFYLIYEADPKPSTPPETIKPEKKETYPNNRYYHLLKTSIDKWYKTVFNDHFEEATPNAGEVKTLIEIDRARRELK